MNRNRLLSIFTTVMVLALWGMAILWLCSMED